MSVTEISKLPLREKFQIMEAIWAELSERAERFEIPPEHLKLLDERRARVESGETPLHDWDTVKHQIGRR